ncbi:MAG: TetR family transcriptional regulator [Candidatus Nanopelagicales bacterium]
MTAVGEAVVSATGGQHRRALLDAAADLTASTGWSGVTMGRLAASVGVSRQTVYNEFGSKPALAEAMVLDELGRFLDAVEQAFDRHPSDAVAAVRDAVRGVLTLAEERPLPRAIVAAGHGAETDLLPLLTIRSGAVLDAATTVVRNRLEAYDIGVSGARLGATVDLVVRAVLSHVMQPGGTPAETADDLAWAVSRLLLPVSPSRPRATARRGSSVRA